MKVFAIILFLLFAVVTGIFTGKNLFRKQKDELYNTKVYVYHKLKVDQQKRKIKDKAPVDRENPSGKIQKNYELQK